MQDCCNNQHFLNLFEMNQLTGFPDVSGQIIGNVTLVARSVLSCFLAPANSLTTNRQSEDVENIDTAAGEIECNRGWDRIVR